MATHGKNNAAAKSFGSGVEVKMQIPFALQCDKCGRAANKGDRFRATKKEAGKDACFDVEIYRFEIRCPSCRNTFFIRTDPGRYDYILEAGASSISRSF